MQQLRQGMINLSPVLLYTTCVILASSPGSFFFLGGGKREAQLILRLHHPPIKEKDSLGTGLVLAIFFYSCIPLTPFCCIGACILVLPLSHTWSFSTLHFFLSPFLLQFCTRGYFTWVLCEFEKLFSQLCMSLWLGILHTLTGTVTLVHYMHTCMQMCSPFPLHAWSVTNKIFFIFACKSSSG